jgi:hypothetical protein
MSQTISADSLFCSSSRRQSLYSGLKNQHLLILPGSESSCSTEQGLCSVLMYSVLLCAERGDYSLLDKYWGFGMKSMKQTGSRQKLSVTRANAASRISSCLAWHLPEPFFKNTNCKRYRLCIFELDPSPLFAVHILSRKEEQSSCSVEQGL